VNDALETFKDIGHPSTSLLSNKATQLIAGQKSLATEALTLVKPNYQLPNFSSYHFL